MATGTPRGRRTTTVISVNDIAKSPTPATATGTTKSTAAGEAATMSEKRATAERTTLPKKFMSHELYTPMTSWRATRRHEAERRVLDLTIYVLPRDI